MQCAEEIPFNSGEDAYTAAQGVQSDIAAFFQRVVNICSRSVKIGTVFFPTREKIDL
ncbi:MAG: hypothetical protein WBL25_18395 [Anaerolineales bacterium]